jgi:hypothetical protein
MIEEILLPFSFCIRIRKRYDPQELGALYLVLLFDVRRLGSYDASYIHTSSLSLAQKDLVLNFQKKKKISS